MDTTQQSEIGYALFRESNDAFFVFDLGDFTVLDVNPTVRRLTGFNRKELLGKNLADLFFSSGEGIDKLIEAMEKTVFFHSKEEYGLQRKELDVLPVNLTVSRVHTKPKPVGLIVARDVSDRKKAQDALLAASRLEATATLAGGIAHDFNNLMTGVLGNAEMLRMEFEDNPGGLEMLDIIIGAAHKAGELSQQMLAFARGGNYQMQVMNLNQAVHDILRIQKHAIPPSIRIERDIDPDLLNIEADPSQMNQIVMNLCINAMEAIEDKGRITITTRNLEMNQDTALVLPDLKPGRYVYLSVEDTGAGMSEETRKKVFEPFFTTKFTGRGLGLAAVFGIVSNHQGKIVVYSEEGQGAIFKIYLPAVESEIPKAPKPRSKLPTGSETILLVDDEELVISLGQRVLERLGYRVLIARNGLEAVEIARGYDGDIHGALLDLGMPIMGGAEAFPELLKARPDLRVLVCSGYELDTPAQALLDAGAKAFVSKPYRLETLAHQLRKALDG